jgi:hypothetical protein
MIHGNGRLKTKKALKELVKAGPVDVYDYFSDPSIFGDGTISAGRHAVVGPEAYQRKWYAEITVDNDSNIVAVK